MNQPHDNQTHGDRGQTIRQQMVEKQIFNRGIRDARLLEAMRLVDREEFVPIHLKQAACEDRPLLIGYEQTISQPYTTAFMINALHLKGHERVLEIGAGSGYAAAILGCLAAEVHSIERIPQLAEQAAKRLAKLEFNNVTIHCGDGTLGLPAQAPFDAIIVAAGADQLPPTFAEQINENGVIVIPIGSARDRQVMHRYRKHNNQLSDEDLGVFAFVPLIGEHGWNENVVY